MSQSWKSSLINSPGFVYFNTSASTPPKTTESSDFLPFSDTQPSPTTNRFDPVQSSSPNYHNFQKGSPRNYQKSWNQNRFSGNNSRGSPAKNFYNNSRNSSYSSYNSSFNESWNRSRDNSFNKHKHRNTEQGEFDASRYLHPSFLEDPWAHLIKQHRMQNESSSSTSVCTSNLSQQKLVDRKCDQSVIEPAEEESNTNSDSDTSDSS